MIKTQSEGNIIIIGGGPAGLGVGYHLLKNKNKLDKDKKIILFDKNNTLGGLSRTIYFRDYFFDIGPHRFYTKNKMILSLWKKILKKELIEVKRLTRILYDGKLFNYPIELTDLILKLNIIQKIKIFFSFLKSKFFNYKIKVKSFEDHIVKNFGKELYEMFFKSYTEKVWGISCKKISAKWADQRIRNLSFFEIIKSALLKFQPSRAKTLVKYFYYPVKGAGYLYEKMGEMIKNNGGEIYLESQVIKIIHKENKVNKIVIKKNNKIESFSVYFLFSSMPITDFVFSLEPKPPKEILDCAKKLFYRHHITVNFLLKKEPFPDNWIYVHSPNLKMARITNYNSFANKKNKKLTPISVEYFVFKNDNLWRISDRDILDFAKKELIKAKFAEKEDFIDGFVIKEEKSYPIYYIDYEKEFEIVKNYINQFKNVFLIGRGGMYKYNNMDHSLLTGILAGENFLKNKKEFDLWKVNEENQYLES